MRKRIISLALILAMMTMFVPSGLMGTTVYAAYEKSNYTTPVSSYSDLNSRLKILISK